MQGGTGVVLARASLVRGRWWRAPCASMNASPAKQPKARIHRQGGARVRRQDTELHRSIAGEGGAARRCEGARPGSSWGRQGSVLGRKTYDRDQRRSVRKDDEGAGGRAGAGRRRDRARTSTLVGDLEATSLDVVDLMFQLKKAFSIEITLADAQRELGGMNSAGGGEWAGVQRRPVREDHGPGPGQLGEEPTAGLRVER